MMKWFMHPLLALIANATEAELAKYVEFLKVENQILHDRLPKRIETTEAERDKLIRVGKPLGHKVKQLISIVTPGRSCVGWRPTGRRSPRRNCSPPSPKRRRAVTASRKRSMIWC